MTVATFLQTNFNTQDPTTYRGAIDANFAVAAPIVSNFAPHAVATPNMTVQADAGAIPGIGGIPTQVGLQTSATLVAPSANPRKDIVYIDAATGVIGVATGIEGVSPVDPALPPGKIPMARLAMTVGMVSITNSIITDLRTVVMAINPAYLSAVAGGSADVITATFTPAPVLADMMELNVRALAANATATPSFNPNGLGALTITKTGGVALAAGDIYGAGHELKFRYRASPARFELLNPAAQGVPAGTIINFAGTTAPSGYLVCPLVATTISRTTFANLFAAIGTAFGAGDGTTTFGLPFFPADYSAVQANANVGTNTVGQVISHVHGGVPNNTANSANGAGAFGGAYGDSYATGGAANLAAGVRVLKCIKY
jgi:hypothetical protein